MSLIRKPRLTFPAAIILGLAVIGSALVLACRDTKLPTAPADGADPQISDAVHGGGKPHFYFLPPLVPAAGAAGPFDPNVAPTVQICVYRSTTDCNTVIAEFTTTTGAGSETVRVDPVSQLHIVNWHTDRFNLDPALTYRIRVLVGNLEMGFADVDVVSSGKQLKNVQTNEYIPLLDGATLPIKFRIEQGLVAQITVAPPDATIVAALTQQFTATLIDLHGKPVSGPPVFWSSSAPPVATVDQTGLATGIAPGQTTISASAAGITGSAALTVTVSTAMSSVTTSSPTVASGSTATLTLQVKDGVGNNLNTSGLTVAFSASGGSSTGTIGATTDNHNGSYTATFTGVLAGTPTTIGATINGTAVTSTLPTIAVTPGPASKTTSLLTTSAPSIVSGSTATLTLQVKDAAGNNLTTGGLTVGFTATGGTSTGTIGATTDGGNGTYTATFTGVLAGTATTINATIGPDAVTTPHPTIVVTVGPASGATSLITTSSPGVVVGSSATLTLLTKDAAGNTEPAGGLAVVFTATGGTSTGTISPATDHHDGTYTATFTGVAAGTATTIGATIGGSPVTSPLPTITVTPNIVVVTVEERIVVTDQSRILPSVSVAVTELVHVTDNERVLPPITVGLVEAIAVSDRSVVLPPVAVSIGETVHVDDQPAVLPPISIAVTESIMVTDAANVAPQ